MVAVNTALPTVWRGVKFRSRLEARWAIFFDQMGIRWAYEPEGFLLPAGPYLPDFHLPDLKLWVEVKRDNLPEKAENLAMELLFELQEATGDTALILCGFPDPDRVDKTGPEGRGSVNGKMLTTNDLDYAFTVCPAAHCPSIGIAYEARAARVCPGHANWDGHGDKNYNGNDPRLIKAYRAGWSMRFGRA